MESVRRNTYDVYRKQLTESIGEFGIDPGSLSSFENPILVRVASEPDKYLTIAKAANISTVAAMRATENAASVVNDIEPNTILSISNMLVQAQGTNIEKAGRVMELLDRHNVQESVSPFIRRIIPDVQYNQFLDTKRGRLNGDGLNFVSTVLEAAALDLKDPVQRQFFNLFAVGTGDITENLRNLKSGLTRAIPKLLQLRAQIRLGQVEAKYDITHYLAGGANWLYEQLRDPDVTRLKIFTNLNNTDLLAGGPGIVPVEVYRHIAATLYINTRSAPAISRLINSYVIRVQEAKAGLFSTLTDESALTISGAWNQSFKETLSPRFTFSPSEQQAYETLTERAIQAADTLPDNTPTGSQIPEELTNIAEQELDKIAILDSQVAERYGSTPTEQAVTTEVLGPPPTRTAQNEAEIKPNDTPRQVAQKTAKALQERKIKPREAEQIQILHNAPQKAIDELHALNPPEARELPQAAWSPEQANKNIEQITLKLADEHTPAQLARIESRANEYFLGSYP